MLVLRPCFTGASDRKRKKPSGSEKRKRRAHKLMSQIEELKEELENSRGKDEQEQLALELPSKRPTPDPNQTQKRVSWNAIGVDASQLTKRHNAQGKTRRADSANTFITVGATTAHIQALEEVYGKRLCPAALCSMKSGVSRLRVCDQSSDARHLRNDSGAHRLPVHSGPKDKKNWKRVEKLTEAALDAALSRE
jgi:hypothetical protein